MVSKVLCEVLPFSIIFNFTVKLFQQKNMTVYHFSIVFILTRFLIQLDIDKVFQTDKISQNTI